MKAGRARAELEERGYRFSIERQELHIGWVYAVVVLFEGELVGLRLGASEGEVLDAAVRLALDDCAARDAARERRA